MELEVNNKLYVTSFLAGGSAGLFVDTILFPLDTLKTRLQAEQGFRKAGGFVGLYKGIGPQAIGSAPQAALFFLTYESIKYYCEPVVPPYGLPFLYMFGASVGEVTACLVRVPMEVVKQRRQTDPKNKPSLRIAIAAYKYEGVIKGLYRGFGSTAVRDLPFSVIQFPMLEYLKSRYRVYFKNNIPVEPWEAAVCGSLAGGFAAAVTTPLDVVKTRIMLADCKLVQAGNMTVIKTFQQVHKKEGFKGLFSGLVPRTLWMTLGGFLFFGGYEFSKNVCNSVFTEVER